MHVAYALQRFLNEHDPDHKLTLPERMTLVSTKEEFEPLQFEYPAMFNLAVDRKLGSEEYSGFMDCVSSNPNQVREKIQKFVNSQFDALPEEFKKPAKN